VHGVATANYPPSGAIIRPGLIFIADTSAINFVDLNSLQAVTITATYNLNYQIPLEERTMLPQAVAADADADTGFDSGMALEADETVAVSTAFVITTGATDAPSAASATSTLAIVIGAVGGFCVVALLVALFMYHRHVKNMMKSANSQQGSQVMQVFVPMSSSSNLASTSAPIEPANQA